MHQQILYTTNLGRESIILFSCISQQAVEAVPTTERGHGQWRQVHHHVGASAAVESAEPAVARRESASASGQDCVNVISSLIKMAAEKVLTLYLLNVRVTASPSWYTSAGISPNREESTA